jgi:hypothetical protein
VSVSYGDPEPSGLASMLGRLIEQNLERDPSRRRLLRAAVATVESVDADLIVTLRFTGDGVVLTDGTVADADVRVRAPSAALLELARSPLLWGLPSPLDSRGRALLLDVGRRRIEIRGLLRHLPAVRRLTMLLSAT